jgi:outer membrane protein assembly factor BamB
LWSGGQCVGGSSAASAYFKKRLYATGDEAGNIIDAVDGTLAGTFPPGGTPAMFTLGHKNFGVAQDGDSTLGCWNAVTGKPVWEFKAASEMQTAPIVVNSVLYATDSLANLYALNLENGKQIWSDNVGDLGYAPILSAGQDALVLANDTKIIAFRPQ